MGHAAGAIGRVTGKGRVGELDAEFLLAEHAAAHAGIAGEGRVRVGQRGNGGRDDNRAVIVVEFVRHAGNFADPVSHPFGGI